jgi:hypothetical protein
MNPTKAEKKYWDLLASEVGCIACRIDNRPNFYVSIHHIKGRTVPGSHRYVLPLCGEHHQTGTEDTPVIHPYKARFEAKYGKQEDLKIMCDKILIDRGFKPLT